MDYLKRNRTVEGEPFEFSKEYTETGAQDPIIFPGGLKIATVTLLPADGLSKLQATTAPEENIKAGTAIWVDHPSGNVAVVLQDKIEPVAAIRVVIASGTASIEVRA